MSRRTLPGAHMPDQAPNITVTGMPRCKRVHRSRVIWFNVLIGLGALLEANVHLLQPLLGVDVYQAIVFVLVVGNGVLRLVTNAGVTLWKR